MRGYRAGGLFSADLYEGEYREREVMTGGGNPLKRKVMRGVCGHAMQRDSRKNGTYRCVTKRLNAGFDCSEG